MNTIPSAAETVPLRRRSPRLEVPFAGPFTWQPEQKRYWSETAQAALDQRQMMAMYRKVITRMRRAVSSASRRHLAGKLERAAWLAEAAEACRLCHSTAAGIYDGGLQGMEYWGTPETRAWVDEQTGQDRQWLEQMGPERLAKPDSEVKEAFADAMWRGLEVFPAYRA